VFKNVYVFRDFRAETQTMFCGLALAPLDWFRGLVMLVALYVIVNYEYSICLRIYSSVNVSSLALAHSWDSNRKVQEHWKYVLL